MLNSATNPAARSNKLSASSQRPAPNFILYTIAGLAFSGGILTVARSQCYANGPTERHAYSRRLMNGEPFKAIQVLSDIRPGGLGGTRVTAIEIRAIDVMHLKPHA